MTDATIIVTRRSPYEGSRLRETLDMAMAFTAFEQPVNMLLLGEAVSLLLSDQNPPPGFSKRLDRLCAGLPALGLGHIFVEAEEVVALGIDTLPGHCEAIARGDLGDLLARHRTVLSV